MSKDYWKLEEDLCRCCHSEGTFQNLAGAYNFDEEEEIYFDMLRETFDVNITPVSGSLCAPTYTICDACITRLRDANSFKKQVIRCEQKFHDIYGGYFIKLADSDCKAEVKEEGLERDTENVEELSCVVEEFADSLDSTQADYHEDDDEASSAKRLKQEGKKKAKKTPQKAKTKAKPKKPPKKSGRPRKIQEIMEEEATGDKDKTDDFSVKPVTSKLEQLLTQVAESDCKAEVKEEGLERDTENVEELSCVVEEFADSLDSTQADYHEDDDEVSNAKRLKQEGKKKAKKTPQKAKTKAKPKKPPKKSGRPRKIHEIMEEEATGDKDKTDDSSVKPVTSKLEQLLTQGKIEKTRVQYYKIVSDKYICCTCDKQFASQPLVSQHHRFVHLKQRPRDRKCPHCDNRIPGYLRAYHLEEAHGIPAPCCGVCGKKFRFPCHVVKHQKKVHMGERLVSCSECHKSFFDKLSLKLHMMTHSTLRKYKCGICARQFRWENNLKDHLKIHAGDKRHICTVCQKAFVQKSTLKQHTSRNHPGRTCQDYLSFTIIDDDDSKKYVCRYCNKTFTEEVLIRHHLLTAHSNTNENNIVKVQNFIEVAPDFKIRFDDMENYICDVCSKEYPNKNSLRYHINLYHRLRKCPDCDLNFTARNLRIHQHEAHDMQLPTCGICGYKSWIRAKVTTHQRKVHMNEKNVSCDQCGMKFFDRINLARHKIAHGTDRKYECSFCHKKYPRLNTLKLHEKIHTKIKDKICSVCGEGFVQKASLNYHMKKHHPEAR